jgi:hypothetical protein
MLRSLLKVKIAYVLVFLYVVQLTWWVTIQTSHPSNFERYFFNLMYGNIAVVSFCSAWVIARRNWGGWQSLMGRMLIFLGLGLFMEWIGILIWFYYNLSGANVPYPSFADIGYFGLIPMYVTASILLAKATGLHFAFKDRQAKFLVLLLPLAALTVAFLLFLRKVGYSGSSPLKLFFNVGYPIGEIIPITIALLVLMLSTNKLTGGVMKNRVLWLIFAFFMQFIAEYVFLYQAGAGIYVNANISDLLYATSYLVMGLSIASFHNIEV